MSSNEADRYALFQSLESKLGPEQAATLMSYLPPAHWGEVATKHDLAVLREQMATKSGTSKLDTRLSELDSRIYQLETRITNQMSDLGNTIRDEMNAWSRTIAISVVGSVLGAVALSFAAVNLR